MLSSHISIIADIISQDDADDKEEADLQEKRCLNLYFWYFEHLFNIT